MNTVSYLGDISFRSDIKALQRGELALSAQIDTLEARFEAIEPSIRAYLPEVDRFDRLRRDAHELEARYPDAAARPPLYGALLGVKDIFHVDGFPTRAGTQVPSELFAGAEADVVRRLKQAGALIVGKTVTTEFAYFEPGPTRNPHNIAAYARRQQQRFGGCHRCRSRPCRDRHPDRRLGDPPGRLLRRRRLQAIIRARAY